MKAHYYIAGTMLAIFGAMLFSPQAYAGERRGHHRVSHSSGHYGGHSGHSSYYRGGHSSGHGGYSSYYRGHQNGHVLGAAVFAIGGLIHHQQHVRNSGHYESTQVLVRNGYYEEYEVHIPSRYDHHGRRIERAHYETRSRWIEPVYRHDRVWIPAY